MDETQRRRRERAPTLGNGLEGFTGEEDLLYDRDDGPESQGEFADEQFGDTAQGGSGDEDFDASYQRDDAAATEAGSEPSITEQGPLRGLPADHEVPGRGEDGGEWATQEEDSAPDVLGVEALGDVAPSAETTARPDTGIEEEITERLADEFDFDPVDVTVEVDGGAVLLRGVVDDLDTRDAVAERAAVVSGVRRVDNQLTVRDAEDPAAR